VHRAYTTQPTNPPTATAPNNPIYSGYIAVFDGTMNLLWAHHLYGCDQTQHCAVTDLAIRVVDGTDVVSYCGISSHGIDTTTPSNNNALNPVDWFTLNIAGTAQGNTNNDPGNWDGFVGRVVNTTSAPGAQQVTFHSVVGGRNQDGLFGLIELSPDRFVVVGSTASMAFPGSSGLDFPFWVLDPMTQSLAGAHCMAVSLVFDLAAAANGRLEASQPLGRAGTGIASVARDVAVSIDSLNVNSPPFHAIHVVGSTNDPSFFAAANGSTNLVIGPQTLLNGTGSGPNSDGFLLVGADIQYQPRIFYDKGTFHGDWGTDALHGVAYWNENRDHVTVFGALEYEMPNGTPPTTLDLDTCTYFLDTPNEPVPPVQFVPHLIRLRRNVEGASLDQFPTAMGPHNVLEDPLVTVAWDDHGTGSPAGGGVSVDERGRVAGVGMTDAASDYPTYPGMPAARTGLGAEDGIRTYLDMVPGDRLASIGTGRTDGTGWPGPIPMPMTSFDGGTTPVCALVPYGQQIGMTTPPALFRMNIDIEGVVRAGNSISILVDRPPATGVFGLSALQVDYPGVMANPVVLVGGQEIYTTYNPIWYPANWAAGQSLRFSMGTLPGSGWAFTVQMVFQIDANYPIPAGQAGSCSGTTLLAASPAIWVAY